MTETEVHFTCELCKKKERLNHVYQLKVQVCDECATKVANLLWFERTGRFLTWENPTKKRGLKRKPIKTAIKIIIWRRDGFKCVFCGTEEHLTIDHIVPVCKGGTDAPENYQTLCKPCNCRKGSTLEVAA